MSKLEHFVLRFGLPLLCAIGSTAFVYAAYHGYLELLDSPYRVPAAVSCIFGGLWLVSWTIVISVGAER